MEKEVEAKLQQLRQREELAQRQQSALAYEKEEIKRRELAAQVLHNLNTALIQPY